MAKFIPGIGSVCAALVAGALVCGSPAQADEFELTAGSSHPPVLPWVSVIRDYVVPESKKQLEAAGHSVKWTEAYAGALYDFKNTLEGIEDGLADIGWVGTLWEPGKMPLQNFQFYVPFAADDIAALAAIMDDLNETVPEMKAAWKAHNQVYLGSQVTDSYVVVSKKPITSLEDMKGLKIMTAGAASQWVAGTGAVTVNGGLPILYNSISTGVADAALVPGTAVLPFKLHEVAPHVTVVNFGPVYGGGLAMNLATWEKLPKEAQDIFMKLGDGYTERVAAMVKANRAKHFAILEKQGAKFYELPAEAQVEWAKGLPNIAGSWVAAMDEKGLPGKAIVTRYMEALRARGTEPIREWDKGL